MSLIIHMYIPGAIVAASDCRVTGAEKLYITPRAEGIDAQGATQYVIGKPEELSPHRHIGDGSLQIPFGHYDYVKTDNEQKTFLLKTGDGRAFAISYCGNANLEGYPTSYRIHQALEGMTDVTSTDEIASRFSQYWVDAGIEVKPSLLISGYCGHKQSVLELRNDGVTTEEFCRDEGIFGLAYHGEQAVMKTLLGIGEYQYSLFRLNDAISFCKTMIATTAKIQTFQLVQQTVSEVCDVLVVTEKNSMWVERSTFEIE